MRQLIRNYISALKEIYESFFFSENLPSDSEDSLLQEVASAYSITDNQVKVLAYLVNYHPTRITEKKLLSVQEDFFAPVTVNSLTELCERGFIEKFPLPGINKFCYSIRNEAFDALRLGETYGRKLFPDCYRELKTVSLKRLREPEWKEILYESAAGCEDKQMWNAIVSLGVREFESDLQDAFWTLARQFAVRFTMPFAFTGTGNDSDGTDYEYNTLRMAMGNLVKMGLAVTIPIEPQEETTDRERYVISAKAVEALFHGHEEFVRYEEIAKQTNVILAKDIPRKELFFTEQSQLEVDNLRRLISPEGFTRAKEILKRQKRNPGVQSLFWGPPGTGKTEVIKQLARESGRDLLIYDSAKVTASAWGATEKNYRALFLGYSYLVAISDNAPILLLNEADQLLSRRLTSIERAMDKSENIISNILLQAFEDMSGILLATTNLVKNLDDAFDRRFLFKTELARPDAEARFKIWKSLVGELSDEDARRLANRFEMTGGQISNVVAKRELAELYYEGDRGYEYICELCRTETAEPVKGSSRKVGY